jgi:hypothetical protein
VAAQEVFQNAYTSNESEDVRAALAGILASLCQRQGAAQSLWDISGPFNLSPRDTQVIANVFEGSEAADPRLEAYRAGFATLVGGSVNFPSSNLAGFSTVEDYLYGLLFYALNHPSPGSQLDDLGEKILQFGASYFDNQESGGWAFALPLLASQQFRPALAYLSESGGSMGRMQATHLGLFLGSALNSETESFGNTLLVDYGQYLEMKYGAVCALEYLRHIPNEHVMKEQVCYLLSLTVIAVALGSLLISSSDPKVGCPHRQNPRCQPFGRILHPRRRENKRSA